MCIASKKNMLNNFARNNGSTLCELVCYYGYCQKANPFLATYSNEYKRSIEGSLN